VVKYIIRLLLFSTISIKIAEYIIGGLVFGDISSFLLYMVGIAVMYLFIKSLLSLISLPSEGAGYLFMSFLLTAITTYVFTLFIPNFSVRSTEVSQLIIFGFMLPSKHLNVVWSGIFSALLISVIMSFLKCVCQENKK
jgi:hypothetical protein